MALCALVNFISAKNLQVRFLFRLAHLRQFNIAYHLVVDFHFLNHLTKDLFLMVNNNLINEAMKNLRCQLSDIRILSDKLQEALSIHFVLLPQYLSLKGLEQLLQTIAKVRRQINPRLEISGILLTMVDARTNYAKEIISLLKETYGDRLNIYNGHIPLSVRAAETSAEGESIYLHDPSGKVAAAYETLVKEVMRDE